MHEIIALNLKEFVKESNEIEGIYGLIYNKRALSKIKKLLDVEFLSLEVLQQFNDFGLLRKEIWMNVSVGNNFPPRGGDILVEKLADLLDLMNKGMDPLLAHQEFETLHPYMDGNGRTGRAIWLWQMINQHNYDVSRGFLHEYYYQSLRAF